MSNFWKGVGKVIGQTGGFVVGVVGGAVEGAKEVLNTGNWQEAGDKMGNFVDDAVEKGGEFGEDALPDVAKGITTAIIGGVIMGQMNQKNQKKPPLNGGKN